MSRTFSNNPGTVSYAGSELEVFAQDIRDFSLLSKAEQENLAKSYFLVCSFERLFNLLEQVEGLDLTNIVDKKKYTLIHSLVLNQSLENLRFVLQYVKQSLKQSKDTLFDFVNWINAPSDGGFTALHYASYRGDIGMCQYLMQNGADYRIKNSKGLNVMHIAAQNDKPISLRFFQMQGMDPSERENKQGNSLHWASFLGSESAILYLTSYSDIDINQPDEQGLSPLHLAVISGNAKAVKRLLIKGANRKSKDVNGKTPGELAANESYENIRVMIDTEGGLEEYCNLKQPFKPLNKNLKQVMVFFGLFFGVELLFVGFIVPCLNEGYLEIGIWIALSVLSLIFHLIAWLRDPGEVSNINSIQLQRRNQKRKKNSESSLSESSNTLQNSYKSKESFNNNSLVIHEKLLEGKNQYGSNDIESVFHDDLLMLLSLYHVDQICMECQILRPPRSKHCEICKKCIRVYDHHCPWINNCVGTKNYFPFILFIITLWFAKLAIISLTVMHVYEEYSHDKVDLPFNWYSSFSEDTFSTLYIIKIIASSIIFLIAVPFFLLLSALVYVQLNNSFKNLTTFERFSKKVKSQGIQDSTLSTSKDVMDDMEQHGYQDNSLSISTRKKRSFLNKSGQCGIYNALQMMCLNQKEVIYNFDKSEFLGKAQQYISSQKLDDLIQS